MKKFICKGTYVSLNTTRGVTTGIVEAAHNANKIALIKTRFGVCLRKYDDLTILSYRGVE